MEHRNEEEVIPNTSFMTLSQYLKSKNLDEELMNVISSSAIACIKISLELQRLPITKLMNNNNDDDNDDKMNVQGEVQKEMDVIANEIFINKVKDSVVVLASEEEEGTIIGGGQFLNEISSNVHKIICNSPTN